MAIKKLTRKQFINLVEKGPVEVGNDLYYVVVRVNDENIEMNEFFKKQMIEENKYNNTYIGFLTSQKSKPYNMVYLPIYGRSDKYETKHFTWNFEDAVMADLRRRCTGLLNRHYEHQINIAGGEGRE